LALILPTRSLWIVIVGGCASGCRWQFEEGTLSQPAANYLDRLVPAARQLLERVAVSARATGAAAYLIGGSVRDLLLGRATVDLDVVIVGDAVTLVRALHLDLGGESAARLRVHDAFGTATLLFPDGLALDLITARHEVYPQPGALPVVTPGTLDDDLRRRDFTINAIAIDLAPPGLGAVLDPLGGQADLARGLVRVLHDGSFVDDPTRLLRGIRYQCRLGFAFDPHTATLYDAASAAGVLSTVSVQRLSHEFVRLLAEERAAAMLDQLVAFGLLAQFPQPLHLDELTRRAYTRLDELWPTLPPTPQRFALWEARFALLTVSHTPDKARDAATGLHLTAGAGLLAEQVARLNGLVGSRRLPDTASALGRFLDPFTPAAIIAVAALSVDDSVRAGLRYYLTTIRTHLPQLNGDALVELGVPRGPIYRVALQALRDFTRDDMTATVEQERAFLLAWLASRQADPGAG
jgi:tRNA nucleotidyltransferase (CCA-adding enzyme)